jgi:hypothetical protein
VEDARKMLLHTSTESLDLKLGALTVDVLKVLCDERGISLKSSGEHRKGELIGLLKV